MVNDGFVSTAKANNIYCIAAFIWNAQSIYLRKGCYIVWGERAYVKEFGVDNVVSSPLGISLNENGSEGNYKELVFVICG